MTVASGWNGHWGWAWGLSLGRVPSPILCLRTALRNMALISNDGLNPSDADVNSGNKADVPSSFAVYANLEIHQYLVAYSLYFLFRCEPWCKVNVGFRRTVRHVIGLDVGHWQSSGPSDFC